MTTTDAISVGYCLRLWFRRSGVRVPSFTFCKYNKMGVAAILGSGYAIMGKIGALGFKGNGE